MLKIVNPMNKGATFPGQHLSAANNADTPTGQHQHANTTPTNPTGTTAPTPPQFNVQVREVDPRVASALTSASNIVSWSLFGGLLGGPVGAMVGGATAAVVDSATRIRAATRARSSNAPPPQPQRMITISTQGTNNNTGRTYRSVQTIRVNPNDHLTNGLLHQLSQTDQRILQMLLMHALQNPNQDIDNMTYDQLLEQFGVGNTQRRGASQGDIDKVPLTKITGEMVQELKEEEIVCNICLEDFKEGEEMRSMDVCCHKFHKECLDRWLSQVASCPVCKKELGGGGGDGDHDHGTNENVAVVEERQEQQSSSN
uniref:RING-type domain-containing protein n=1 Tax=Ditylum brightwellii TaxID=49249 RepID=A0A7S1ZYX0_9STRA|mmetsp:Transcript_4959/g.7598  ORF Transcript_4959/g.7598 Transcript_4959/m.7598 type:complete len:313 (+) Transcript_4959:372-1310(+)